MTTESEADITTKKQYYEYLQHYRSTLFVPPSLTHTPSHYPFYNFRCALMAELSLGTALANAQT